MTPREYLDYDHIKRIDQVKKGEVVIPYVTTTEDHRSHHIVPELKPLEGLLKMSLWWTIEEVTNGLGGMGHDSVSIKSPTGTISHVYELARFRTGPWVNPITITTPTLCILRGMDLASIPHITFWMPDQQQFTTVMPKKLRSSASFPVDSGDLILPLRCQQDALDLIGE